MSKMKKKRNKVYRGVDAKTAGPPVLHRYTAVRRSRLGQWWHDRRRFLKPVLLVSLIIVLLVWLLVSLLLNL